MDIKEALTLDGLKYFYTKYIKPLKTGAFSTVVNNATTTVANTVLDGRMGKTLADKDANLQNQINTLNSSLIVNISEHEYKTHESIREKQVYAFAYDITLENSVTGKLIEVNINMKDATSAWIDMANSYIYNGYVSYPLTYADYTTENIISAYIDHASKKLFVMQKGDWSKYRAWIVIKRYK